MKISPWKGIEIMTNAVLPLLGYVVLQFLVMIVGQNISGDKELTISAFLKAWILGQMLLFAILQILAVPMILLHWRFDALFWTFFAITAALCVLGLRKLFRRKIHLKPETGSLSWLSILLLIATLVIITTQSHTYFFGIHLDEDDARWLAETNDALEYGQMLTRSHNTGEYLGRFTQIKDVTSPWPMLFAILSRVLNTRVAIVAHTIYPTVEVFALYGIYYLIAEELLEKREARYAFLLFVAILICFFGGNVYTQGAFSLVRIWQGKASVAGVAVPFILYLFVCIHRRNIYLDWLKVAMAGLATCLMSGMGVYISLIMIGVYGLYNIIAYKHWKRIPLWFVSLLPSFVMAVTYYCLKG